MKCFCCSDEIPGEPIWASPEGVQVPLCDYCASGAVAECMDDPQRGGDQPNSSCPQAIDRPALSDVPTRFGY